MSNGTSSGGSGKGKSGGGGGSGGKNYGMAAAFGSLGFVGGFTGSLLDSHLANQEANYNWRSSVNAVNRENNQLAEQLRLANRRTADVYGYQTDRFKKQAGFIEEEYNRAGEDLQRQLQGAFAQSAYARQAQLAQLAQMTGYNTAATGSGNRSRARADLLGTLGNFGRNQAMEAERLSGQVGQINRNRAALGRQAQQSTFNAYGDLGILPELQRYYGAAIPDAPFRPNGGLMIAKAAMAGIGSGMNALGMVG